MARQSNAWTLLIATMLLAGHATADDWARFRGPNGSGISPSTTATPLEWSDSKNLKWKTELPGPGASCPIVVGDRVFLTCWTGYGIDRSNVGNQEDLVRHLICLNKGNGEILWQKSVPAKLPEDVFEGMFAENGYATHTPVCDGERVFAFFGKSGVHAYDMEGNELWSADVGSDLDRRKWGSASSPILYKDLLIVPAVVESHALIALNKKDGSEAWRQEAEGFGNCWSTPILADLPDGSQEIVMAVPMEVWGINPDNGQLKWHAKGPASDSMCSSVIVHDGVAYVMERGPRGGGTVAIRIGGNGDVTKTHTVWTGAGRNRIGTPVAHGDSIYWIADKIANSIKAADGSEVYKQRLDGSGAPPPDASNAQGGGRGAQGGGRPPGPPGGGGGGGGGGRRGGGRGGPGGQDYSSPVVADGKIYYATRDGTVHVIALGPTFNVLAKNKFSDSGEIVSTPAISDGEIYLRSSKFLYCIAQSE